MIHIEHSLELEGPIAYPGGKDGFYRGRCSQGDWESTDLAPETEIHKAFSNHQKSMIWAENQASHDPDDGIITAFVGKRLSTNDPLTPHDVAERLDKAALRVLRIMMDVRQAEGDLWQQVKTSRYLTILPWLAAELQAWGVEPQVPPDAREGPPREGSP